MQTDSSGLIYLSLVKSGYNDRFVSSLLTELRQTIEHQGLNRIKHSPEESYTLIMENDMKRIYNKYNETSSLDKINTINEKVLAVKNAASEGVQNAMRNLESAELLADKSSVLEGNSRLFKNDARKLERITYWRKIKILCILGTVILGVLLYIISPILISSDN